MHSMPPSRTSFLRRVSDNGDRRRGADVSAPVTTDDAANATAARSGLLTRILIAFGGLAAGIALVFLLLLVAVGDLRHRSLEARRSQQVIATANAVQTLVI